MKIRIPNIFDLVQNSKTIYSSLDKKRSFSDYVNEASRIYFNYKRSNLTASEFSQKTGIPKNTLVLLGAMKKLNGDYWPELHLKINEINTVIDHNIKELNNCISLLENCPIENGYRKYDLDVLYNIFAAQYNHEHSHFFDYLNIIGFDLGQYEKCKMLVQTSNQVQKDVKKAAKIRKEKIVKSFKDHPIVIDVKLSSTNWKDDISQKLDIVSKYRELSAIENGYIFKQFCIDCNLTDKYKSLNYYHLNFEKAKEKFDKSQKGIANNVNKLIKNGKIFENTRGGGEKIISETGAIGSKITIDKNENALDWISEKEKSDPNFKQGVDKELEILELKKIIKELEEKNEKLDHYNHEWNLIHQSSLKEIEILKEDISKKEKTIELLQEKCAKFSHDKYQFLKEKSLLIDHYKDDISNVENILLKMKDFISNQ